MTIKVECPRCGTELVAKKGDEEVVCGKCDNGVLVAEALEELEYNCNPNNLDGDSTMWV